MHGLAFNVNCDLKYFDYIVPCGIENKSITSVHVELKYQADMATVKSILQQKLVSLFEMTVAN
jgi:lipoyl(octanoyl) transferase